MRTPSAETSFAVAYPRRRLRVVVRYVRLLLGEFRWTLAILLAGVVLGTVLHAITPDPGTHIPPSLGLSVYASWMALFAQPTENPPPVWYLAVLYAAYPVLGFILVGEGVVRLALLMMSRRYGEKEWMLVLASTYRDHVVLCGLGHLGFRVLEQLVRGNTPVVVIEKVQDNPFVTHAKPMNVPILIRDMKEDQALVDAGVKQASAIIIASNDDIANFEVALDARRLNPRIRIVMRLFDQQLASKISGALTVDAAFSASALAAPVVAAMSLHSRVLSSLVVGGEPYVIAEVTAEEGSAIAGRRIADVEGRFATRVLARTPAGATQPAPSAEAVIVSGETLVVYTRAAELSTIAAAALRRA